MHKAMAFYYCFSNQYLVETKKNCHSEEESVGRQGGLKVGTVRAAFEFIPRIKHNTTKDMTCNFL